MKSSVYYAKYWKNGFSSEDCGSHELYIWLTENVTVDDLLAQGFVMGDEEECVDGDFYVDEDGGITICFPVPLNGDRGVSQEDLDDGVKLLPFGWEENVPSLIGIKPEWVAGVSMDG